ncbi:hypothetical protein QEN19_002186 [Hanseniaspora menglaensis]
MAYYDDNDDNEILDNMTEEEEIMSLKTDMDLQIFMTEDENDAMIMEFPILVDELKKLNFIVDEKDINGILLMLKKYLLLNDFLVKETVDEATKKMKFKKVKTSSASKPIENLFINYKLAFIMDLRTRIRNKLNSDSNEGGNDLPGTVSAESIPKLTLGERIRLKKLQHQEYIVSKDKLSVPIKNTNDKFSISSQNNNELNLDRPLSLKEKLMLKKKQMEKPNELIEEYVPEIKVIESSKTDINFKGSTTINPTRRQIYHWFNSLTLQLSSENRIEKKRTLDTEKEEVCTKKAKLNTGSTQKIDDELYRIIYPFTNIKSRAITNFSKPSPDSIVLIANQQAELNQLSLKSMSLGNKPKVSASVSSSNSKAVNFIRDVYTEHPHLSLCILGHIDSGKSTLTGRLLLDTNAVSQQQIATLQKQSKELGKQSFWLAWLMDSDSEERERGITKKFGYARFQSKMGLNYTLLDAPGHSDFISSTIIAIQQASICTIVVDCSIGGFEKSFDGQLTEHLLLACKFVSNPDDLIFVMNKMDSIDWDKKRYTDIKTKITNYMIGDLKINESVVKNLEFIPVSSIEGDNVVKSLEKDVNLKTTWYKGLSFIEKLDEKNLEHFKTDFPQINETYVNQKNTLAIVLDTQQQSKNNGSKQKGKDCSLTVKIIDGYLAKSDKIGIAPRLTSKGYEIDDIWMETKEITNKNVPFAIKNQFVTLKLKNCNVDMVSVGDIISLFDEKKLVSCSHEFQLKLETFAMSRPLLPGSPIVIYMNDVEIPCMISSIKVIKEIIDGENITKKKLKHLTSYTSNATINIEIQEITESIKSKELGFSQDEDPAEDLTTKVEEESEETFKRTIPVFTSKENKQLSKVLIRKDGKTIAFGNIHKRLD